MVISLVSCGKPITPDEQSEQEEQKTIYSGELFSADQYESIQMYGDPKLWDDEKNLSLDLDGDGTSEEFVITKDFNDTIVLRGTRGSVMAGMEKEADFWSADLARMLPNELKKGDSITDDSYVQISCCDLDEDGMPEVLVSAGNKYSQSLTLIYEYSLFENTPPFLYCGSISNTVALKYIGASTLRAFPDPADLQKYDTYLYEYELIRKFLPENATGAAANIATPDELARWKIEPLTQAELKDFPLLREDWTEAQMLDAGLNQRIYPAGFRVYYNDSVNYQFGSPYGNGLTPDSLRVYGLIEVAGPRKICVGDSFEEVLAKFPEEQDWRTSENGLFYGQMIKDQYTAHGHAYEFNDTKRITLAPSEGLPFIQIDFKNDILTEYRIYFISD
jgi:hypothetical protein